MGKLRGQISPDFAVSAFFFSIVVLFLFYSIATTYYSRAWEMRRAETTLEAMKLAFFLVGDEGTWTPNPLQSSSLGLKGEGGINETKLRWFVGMPYPHVINRTGLTGDFKMEIYELPSIAIKSDVKEQYLRGGEERANLTIGFETSKNATLYMVVVGGNVTSGGDYGISEHFQSTGEYHIFHLVLPAGVYTIKALAVGDGYGAYEASFRVV